MGKLEMPCFGHYLGSCPSRVTFGIGDKPLCDGCGGSDGDGFVCDMCNLQAHKECIEWSLKFAGHANHQLKKVSPGSLDYTDGQCHYCREIPTKDFYHCSICDFSIDEHCKRRQLYTITNLRIHNHSFTLLSRKISFTCNACGFLGERNPYVCIECNFMIHKDCISLPRVININRHEHRISLTYHLGRGNWELCGVCRKKIDWNFGAFSCKRCPGYAVHSKCATDSKVWDGEELEDVPEVEEEILDPYKVINENEINHFSHEEHDLRLGVDNVTDFEMMRCDACILPLNDGMFYKCMQCDFFLHKVCANLPRKRRHVLHNHKLNLQVDYCKRDSLFQCFACKQFSTGFRYECLTYIYRGEIKCQQIILDSRCGSISEPFHHVLHPHPLYFTLEEFKTCVACDVKSPSVLSCTICDFALDIKCATLPTKVRHKCDDNYLSLCLGDKYVGGEILWCDICETKTDPNVWFYTNEDYGAALHVKCVLGDLYYFKPEVEVIINSDMTRPFCIICKVRCIFPFYLRLSPDESYCSLECLSTREI
uniref:Phorbol-ester/DAG-type domain-containing protein n=1 Tax=Noccaea caerulescens TaxID=107243 RepID=A0A1J3HP25_NOCCA